MSTALLVHRHLVRVDPADVIRARDGDDDAFATLVNSCDRQLHAFVLRLVGNREDANDLTQEIWLRVSTGLTSLRKPEDFAPWLYRLARNRCLDFIRARKTRVTIQTIPEASQPDMLSALDSKGATPEARLLSLDERRLVWEASGELSARDRQLLRMREYEEQSYLEIAGSLGISAGAAKVGVFRARERFRRNFGHVEQADPGCTLNPLLLVDLLDGELDVAVRSEVELHIDGCPACALRVRSMRDGRGMYRAGLAMSLASQSAAPLASPFAQSAYSLLAAAPMSVPQSSPVLLQAAGPLGRVAAMIAVVATTLAGAISDGGDAAPPSSEWTLPETTVEQAAAPTSEIALTSSFYLEVPVTPSLPDDRSAEASTGAVSATPASAVERQILTAPPQRRDTTSTAPRPPAANSIAAIGPAKPDLDALHGPLAVELSFPERVTQLGGDLEVEFGEASTSTSTQPLADDATQETPAATPTIAPAGAAPDKEKSADKHGDLHPGSNGVHGPAFTPPGQVNGAGREEHQKADSQSSRQDALHAAGVRASDALPGARAVEARETHGERVKPAHPEKATPSATPAVDLSVPPGSPTADQSVPGGGPAATAGHKGATKGE
jgi:RNA polymerase sigma-70 factor, ECF subfamily